MTGRGRSLSAAAFREAAIDLPVAAQSVIGRVAVSPTKLSGVSATTIMVLSPQISGGLLLRSVKSSQNPPYGICFPARLLHVAQPVSVTAQRVPIVIAREPISTAFVVGK